MQVTLKKYNSFSHKGNPLQHIPSILKYIETTIIMNREIKQTKQQTNIVSQGIQITRFSKIISNKSFKTYRKSKRII